MRKKLADAASHGAKLRAKSSRALLESHIELLRKNPKLLK